MAYPCPCCDNLTLPEEPPGTFQICEVCFWEDDNVQFDDPSYWGGANVMSLTEARRAYQLIGAKEERFLKFVRQPHANEIQ